MSIRDILARTRHRKVQGESQTYPQHAGKSNRGVVAPSGRLSLPVLAREPCAYEGRILSPCHSCQSEQRHVRDCELHGTCTRAEAHKDVDRVCATCPTYTSPEREGDVRCGVVIGSYKWPELVDLQIRVIRSTCGPVPVLVSNDHPGSHDTLASICSGHPDVTLLSNPERLGHTGGDLAVYHRAVTWGSERRLQVVAKLSQRLLFTEPYWLQNGAKELLASGLGTATRACTGPTGSPRYPLRTEFALLDVARWNSPEVLASVTPRRVWHEREGGWPAEQVIDELVRDHFDGLYWPFAGLPTVREERGSGFLWHHSHSRQDYDSLAKRFGVTLPADFTVAGWEQEYARGEYLFG